MRYLIPITGLVELELEEKWEEARQMLYTIWRADQSNLGVVLRLGTECWYVLAHWEVLDNTELDYDMFRATLVEVTRYGVATFSGSPVFLMLYGYMVSLFPFLFIQGDEDNDQYLNLERLGRDMLKKAKALKPNDSVIAILCEGAVGAVRRNSGAVAQHSPAGAVCERFPGNTAIEKYFRDVLRRPSRDL